MGRGYSALSPCSLKSSNLTRPCRQAACGRYTWGPTQGLVGRRALPKYLQDELRGASLCIGT